MPPFKRAAFFGDIHFGKKSDSEIHNQDCVNYINWFMSRVEEYDCDRIVFLGDWFDNRSRLRIDTLHYSTQAIDLLTKPGIPVYWLIGNHDMFHKTTRDIYSLCFLKNNPHIKMIDEVLYEDDVLYCPWLVGQEFTQATRKCKYVFGHFELPLFLTNETYEMPDHGGLTMNHFENCDAVYSGHFHKRQTRLNSNKIPVTYIGNPFAHSFNDVNDPERGCMILDWDKDPFYLDWMDGPNYNRLLLSEMVAKIEDDSWKEAFNSTSIIECEDDMGIDFEESLEIKNIMLEHVRDFNIRQRKIQDETLMQGQELQGEDTDELVVQHLRNLDTKGSEYDSNLLIDIYERVQVN
jgi:DNA repair exonuclease SbcCD nuclease subunit